MPTPYTHRRTFCLYATYTSPKISSRNRASPRIKLAVMPQMKKGIGRNALTTPNSTPAKVSTSTRIHRVSRELIHAINDQCGGSFKGDNRRLRSTEGAHGNQHDGQAEYNEQSACIRKRNNFGHRQQIIQPSLEYFTVQTEI